jgi:hypothetical protein
MIFIHTFVLFVIIGSMFHGYQQTYQKPIIKNLDVYVFIAALCMALADNPVHVIVNTYFFSIGVLIALRNKNWNVFAFATILTIPTVLATLVS